jgi:SAM-dependent methyltransferase
LIDYTAAYEAGDNAAFLGRWRALGAASKAGHVRALLGPTPVASLVDIGCGDGAVLAALEDVAARRAGFELSPTAVSLARQRFAGSDVAVEVYDGARVPADAGSFSVALVSHVLEHVTEPEPLLREAARVGARVIVEVPLEANRSARRPAKVAEARSIGHIQAFSRADIEALAGACGLRVVASVSDPLPYAHHAFFAADARARAVAALKWAVRRAAWQVAPRAAERWFTVHYAALLARD